MNAKLVDDNRERDRERMKKERILPVMVKLKLNWDYVDKRFSKVGSSQEVSAEPDEVLKKTDFNMENSEKACNQVHVSPLCLRVMRDTRE